MSTTASLSARDALAAVLEPGQDIVVGQGHGAPRTLIAALAEHRERLAGSRVFVGLLLDDFPELPDAEIRTFFPSGPFGSDDAMAARGIDYARQTLYELASGLRSGTIPVDIAIGQATPARAGRRSLGVTVDYMGPAVDRAAVVVVETGGEVPWSGDASTFAEDQRVLTVASDARPLTVEPPGPPTDSALARRVAEWIPDEATLQLGIGHWVPALAERLAARRGLRMHTGLLGDWTVDLERAGALDPSTPIVATAAAGTRALYRWLEEAGRAELAPADVTHAPDTLRALPRFRAVNSVLELDLLGRANSEVGAGGRRGGIGGLKDFAGAAADNPEGLSILALPATTGDRSRVVPALDERCVSLDAAAVDVVVTEHGSADLRGLDARDRAAAVLGVAAPVHRPQLERAARERGLL
jgi:acyl-CoA hydrolase